MLTYSSIVGSFAAAIVSGAAYLAGAPILAIACFATATFLGSATLALVSFRVSA